SPAAWSCSPSSSRSGWARWRASSRRCGRRGWTRWPRCDRFEVQPSRLIVLAVVVVLLLAGGGYLISRAAGGGGRPVTIELTVSGLPYLHGFAARYDLPGPLVLYLFAAGGVVVVSFVMVVLFAGDRLGAEAVRYPRRRVPWLEGAASAAWPRVVGGSLGVAS